LLRREKKGRKGAEKKRRAVNLIPDEKRSEKTVRLMRRKTKKKIAAAVIARSELHQTDKLGGLERRRKAKKIPLVNKP